MNKKSSIELSEVEKFNQLSLKWWDEGREFKILHKINPIRLEFITDKVKNHFNNLDLKNSLTNLEILDVGCGGGLIDVPLARLGTNIATDASSANIKTTSKYATECKLKINYQNSTVEELTLASKQYDVVLCLEVIEHVANLENFIKNLSNLTKSGGMIIFSTINWNVKSYLLAIIMAKYILNWVPRKTHDHSKFLKPLELNSLLNKSNLILK